MRTSRPSISGCLAVLLFLICSVWQACQPALAYAGDRNPDNYPLRVHVFDRRVHHNRRFDSYSGTGHANIIEGDQTSGAEFTYLCSFKFLDSEADEYYPARWKKDGLSLEILTGVIGSDTKTRTCEFKVALKDFVFSRERGHLVTLSQQEYADTQQAAAERQQALMPVDLDPSHYPLDFSLLHVTWTGELNGIHVGTGQGNLRTEAGINAVDFSIHCPVKIQPTPEGRFLAGQWLRPGTNMLLLLRSIDVDGAPGATCQLVTVVDPDVYIRAGGGVKAISQQEYAHQASPAGPRTP